jgi:hypothetical protein
MSLLLHCDNPNLIDLASAESMRLGLLQYNKREILIHPVNWIRMLWELPHSHGKQEVPGSIPNIG